MPKKATHVLPGSNTDWKVLKGGARRATRIFDNQDDAVRFGQELSKSQGTDLYIHRRDGTVESKESYG